jgi:tetratricopeptide (TPR) repeat protein
MLWRERGSDHWVAKTLVKLSRASRDIRLHEEGIQQAKEALEIFERLCDVERQADCLGCLAWSLYSNKEFDAAEEAAFRVIDLREKDKQFRVCNSYRVLGNTNQSKGDIRKAIHHFELALGIGSPFNWHGTLFCVNYELAQLFHSERTFDDAQAHIEHPEPHTVDSAYNLGSVMPLQARVWYGQQT